MKYRRNQDRNAERGMALITALMMSTILLALGMTVVFSATTDTVITRSQRLGEQSFFAADAGVAIARRALASGTRLTITAQRHITVTGDIKYTDPVVDSFGNPVSNIASVQNVLGIFTNDGNIYTKPSSQYVSGPGLSMELSAAVAAFNAITSNDNGVMEGSFTYKSGSSNPGNNDVFVLAGSRVQSKANLTNYRKVNRFFDVRFSGGKFAPPFYPGTSYSLTDETTSTGVAISVIDDPRATGMTWFRENK